MTLLQPATPRVTKADLVFEELRRQLLAGERKAGEVLSTYALAEEFGVSRRPVMDAVARLQGAGFLEIVSQVGCRVIVPSVRDMHHHIEVTTALNSFAAKVAAERSTPAALDRIQAACDELDRHVADGDVEAFDRANVTFHRAIVAAAENPRLEALTEQAWDLARFFRYPRPPEMLPQLQQEHRDILAAIRAGDGESAHGLAELHQSHAKEWAGEPEPDTR
ncbi:GntR family transcriptional regulator [Streptomyces spongiae]|uniref:GntR family transcriptional regulator n=1 Tax=Streptomyces spongiae TaxID=565072 RepID=A0A5N8X9Q9_9ACTN|nr:GntR family transcriptional regulator [Streptomyces spongiae]MPY56183.1 GntR family transcriptional regulator [Streptomyces spongiae]